MVSLNNDSDRLNLRLDEPSPDLWQAVKGRAIDKVCVRSVRSETGGVEPLIILRLKEAESASAYGTPAADATDHFTAGSERATTTAAAAEAAASSEPIVTASMGESSAFGAACGSADPGSVVVLLPNGLRVHMSTLLHAKDAQEAKLRAVQELLGAAEARLRAASDERLQMERARIACVEELRLVEEACRGAKRQRLDDDWIEMLDMGRGLVAEKSRAVEDRLAEAVAQEADARGAIRRALEERDKGLKRIRMLDEQINRNS